MFGGVHDVEQSEDGIDSEFFNQLFAWNIERNRFMPLALRKARNQKKVAVEPRGGRRGRGQANEDELLRNLAALNSGASLDEADDMELEKKEEEVDETPKKDMPITMEPPHMRFNAQLTVQDDVLYIYGGTFEKGDREFTFDDLYAIDLGKLDGCKEIFMRPVEDWIVSAKPAISVTGVLTSMQESDDEDDDEDDEDDEEEEDDEEDEGEGEEDKSQMYTPSKRKKKQDEMSDTSSEADTTPSVTSDDDDTETTATTVDDGLPHPRVSLPLLALQSIY
jgi:hypothetical protein